VYRVRWGAKELRDFGVLGASALGKAGITTAIKIAAAAATKAGARLIANIVGPAMVATDLAKNPWHVAKSRADKTGVIVGDLLARTESSSYVLIGHSLGARVMVVAAESLGTKPGGPRVQSVHLLGAAIGARSNWDSLTAAVDDVVYNYHSTTDNVLKYVYKTVQAGETAAGLTGFTPISTKLQNIDVTDAVSTHFDYQDNVTLRSLASETPGS
jgi:pimeloyl-ACP methyl ester carboxylesterase